MVQDDNVNAKQESKAAEDMENNEIISCVNVYQDQNGNSGESNNTESRPQSQTNYAIPGNKANYISVCSKTNRITLWL